MAVWADISYLEGPSDDEGNTSGTEWCDGHITQCSSPKSSIEDLIPVRNHITTTSNSSVSGHEKIRIFDGDDFQTSAPKPSADLRSTSLLPTGGDCHYSCSVHQPPHPAEPSAACGLLRQRQMNADYFGVHGITFSITCPDDTTVAIPSNYDEETPLLYTAGTEMAHSPLSYDLLTDDEDIEHSSHYDNDTECCNEAEEIHDGHEMNIGLGIDDENLFRHIFPTNALTIILESDQQLIFGGIEQEDFDHLLASDDAFDEIQSGDEPASPTGIESFWFEVDYSEISAEDLQAVDSIDGSDDDTVNSEFSTGPATPRQNNWDDEAYGSIGKLAQLDLDNDDPDLYHFVSNDSFDDFDSDIDSPLSHFQPLPIGSFAPDSPPNHLLRNQPPTKEHYHLLPTLTHNPENNTLNVTFTIDENWNCPVFESFRSDIVRLTECPVLLSRRVYELQGYIQENGKTERAFRRFMKGWRRVGSPLTEEWEVEVEVEDEESEEEGGVRLTEEDLNER